MKLINRLFFNASGQLLLLLFLIILEGSFSVASAATKKEEQQRYEEAAVPLRARFQSYNVDITNYNQRKDLHGLSIEQYNAKVDRKQVLQSIIESPNSTDAQIKTAHTEWVAVVAWLESNDVQIKAEGRALDAENIRLNNERTTLSAQAAKIKAWKARIAAMEERLQIWVKAFIPQQHPSNPSYTQKVPGQSGQWMIAGPPLLGSDVCFLTSNRGFSNDINAESKATRSIVLVVSDTIARIDDSQSLGHSQKVKCSTGAIDGAAKVAVYTKNAMGGPHVANDEVQVIFDVAAKNPYMPTGVLGTSMGTGLVWGPSIDFDLDIIYNRKTRELKYRSSMGKFPSFEAYASLDGGPIKTLFTREPTGDTVWSLLDFGLGIGNQTANGSINL